MNVFTFEFKSTFPSITKWGVGSAILILVYASFYPPLAPELEHLMKAVPAMYQSLLGLDLLTSFTGFYTFFSSYLMLALGIQAIGYGMNIYAKESNLKTADFLYSKPMKRTSIVGIKYCASIISVCCTWLIAVIIIMSGLHFIIPTPLNLSIIMLINFAILCSQLFCLTIGALIASLVKHIRRVNIASLSVALGFYFITILAKVMSEANLLYLTPFGYFDTQKILLSSTLDFPLFLISITLSLLSIGIALILFSRKDLESV